MLSERSSRQRAITFASVLGLLLFLTGVGARAQAEAPPAAMDAHALFLRGLSESSASQWEAARASYLESLLRAPHVSTYFNLAIVSIKLGKGHSALEALEEFLRRADAEQHADYLARALTLRSQALTLVAKLQVTVTPEHARVRLDQREVPSRAEALRTFEVDPGTHTVQVEAPGHEPLALGVELSAGETQRLALVLDPVPSGPGPRVEAPRVQRTVHAAFSPEALVLAESVPVDQTRSQRSGRRWLWASAAALAVGVAVATIVVVTHGRDGTTSPGMGCGSAGLCF